jgi:hypothetical protein
MSSNEYSTPIPNMLFKLGYEFAELPTLDLLGVPLAIVCEANTDVWINKKDNWEIPIKVIEHRPRASKSTFDHCPLFGPRDFRPHGRHTLASEGILQGPKTEQRSCGDFGPFGTP